MSRFTLITLLLCLVAGCARGRSSEQIKFIAIPPGEFQMGSPVTERDRFDNESPLHRVRITHSFEIAATPVTVAQFAQFIKATGYHTAAEREGWAYGAWNTKANQWDKLAGASWRNPGFAQGNDHPVVDVNFDDAVAYCEWLSKKEGRTIRLPTEAEWEYVCRAGTTTAYPWGDDPIAGNGFLNGTDETSKNVYNLFPPFEWPDGYLHTAPVTAFKPNAWGVYDTLGNTLEWCTDYFADYPKEEVTNPTGPKEGKQRILRGGAFVYGPKHCRSAFRGRNDPEFRNFYIGFRVVRETVQTPDRPARSDDGGVRVGAGD